MFTLLQVRLDTGRKAGCGVCSRLFLKYQEAKRHEKSEVMGERMLHREYVANQRLWHQTELVQDLTNPNVENMVQDGFDTFKAKAPLYGLAKSDGHGLETVHIKISATINFGKQCVFFMTPPWVMTGGNLCVTSFMANMAIRMANLPPGMELPKLLKLLFDGGPENWCSTFFLFVAWMVGTRMYEEIYLQRLPAHHAYNGLDAKFQPASTYFSGTANGRAGKNVHTLEEYFGGLKKAYQKPAGKEARGAILGGEPVFNYAECAYDFQAFIDPYKDEEFHGWGHSFQQWFDDQGGFVSGRRGSSIHYMHYFKDAEGMVRMRYKMAATYPEDSWMPKGPNGEIPDGKISLGCTPFSVSAAELPTGTPQWADFKANWDEDTIKKSILSMHRKLGEEFMPAVSHTSWEQWFSNIPSSPEEVSAQKQPVWGSFQRRGPNEVRMMLIWK